MPSLVYVLIVVVLLTAAFAVFYAHRRFRLTRPCQWRGRVRARVAELVRQGYDLRLSPSGRPADRWRAELFHQHLRTLPLTALLPYPGIGPGAVERLSAAGLRSVADLTRFDVQRVQGFGPAKSADVRAAVRQLVREAEGRFDAGACPEGLEFRRQVAAQAAAEQAEAEERRLLVEAVNATLARMAPLERLADRVTFLNYLLGRPTPGLTDEVMARPLPTVGAVRTDSRSHPSDVRDSLTAVLQDDEEVCPPMPTDPVLVDVTVRCPGCGAKLRARSSRPRVRFRVGCPRCGSQAVVELPQAAHQPPVVTPIAPPLPTPVATTAPPVVRPAPPVVMARPASPQAVVPPPPAQPDDLFQAALAARPQDVRKREDNSVPADERPAPSAPPAAATPARTESVRPHDEPVAEPPHLHRLRVFARFLYMVADADGRVDHAERAAVRTFLVERFGNGPAIARHTQLVIEQAEATVPSEEVAVREVLTVATNTERKSLYKAAVRVTNVSGVRNTRQQQLLDRLQSALAFQKSDSSEPYSYADPLPQVSPAIPPVLPAAPTTTESPHLHRLRVFARFGFVVAKADGRVAKAERAAIRSFLADLFGHDPVLVRHLDPVIEQVEVAIPAEEVAVREVLAVATNPEDRRAVYAAAERIAAASGEKNQREEEMLGRLRAALGVQGDSTPPPLRGRSASEASRVGGSSATPHPPTPAELTTSPARGEVEMQSAPDPRAVLEIEPGVELSADLIRRRYTLLTDKADPAKAAVMGPEFAALAERKRADLRRAAEGLIARFGVPLDPPAAPPPPADLRHNPDLDDIFGG